jgi:hypothetical protein
MNSDTKFYSGNQSKTPAIEKSYEGGAFLYARDSGDKSSPDEGLGAGPGHLTVDETRALRDQLTAILADEQPEQPENRDLRFSFHRGVGYRKLPVASVAARRFQRDTPEASLEALLTNDEYDREANGTWYVVENAPDGRQRVYTFNVQPKKGIEVLPATA